MFRIFIAILGFSPIFFFRDFTEFLGKLNFKCFFLFTQTYNIRTLITINSQFLQRMIAQRVPRGLLERLEANALKTRVVVHARLAAVLVSITVLAAHRPRRRRYMCRGLFATILCTKRKIVFVPTEHRPSAVKGLRHSGPLEGGGLP